MAPGGPGPASPAHPAAAAPPAPPDPPAPLPAPPPQLHCGVCGALFPSRNKLFAHLELEGHHLEGTGEAAQDPAASVRENADFREYYRLQGIAGSDEDWRRCYELFQQELPVCFRLTLAACPPRAPRGPGLAEALLREAGVDFAPAAYHFGCDGGGVSGHGRCSLWTLSGHTVRRGVSSGLETAQFVGLLQRQEQNSALPPLLLGVRESDKVLDLCAAPGSKSLQLLDLMLADSPPGALPSGMLVANDVSRARASVMARRAREQLRSCLISPSATPASTPRCGGAAASRCASTACCATCPAAGTARCGSAGRSGAAGEACGRSGPSRWGCASTRCRRRSCAVA
ncbi:unnamed protein product [Prorocentrum cordatum]|uniref:C2H2-type domain-containing protein n=1 Tax=Prorocentrum cordatum TaxID=2364126 RepID=A0ABN9V4E1_9DINO|nr:unnamed protein product [Polarella glacialis]